MNPRLKRSEPPGDYNTRLASEQRTYQDCLDVHDLPDIFHYWSNKHIRPKLEPFGFGDTQGMFRKYLEEQCQRRPGSMKRFVSIGCGNGDAEIEFARHLQARGHADFVIDCLDLNPAMLERGRAAAANAGIALQVNCLQVDFNAWKSDYEYDAVIALQSLHHVLNLEHLFAEIKRSLKPQGTFLIADMIGRNGHQRWPEALEIVREFWRTLPPSYRFNHALHRYEEDFEDWDCSAEGFEGIRSQEILPLLLEYFHFQLFIGFGNVIDPFVDRAFGHSFDPSEPWDQSFIDRVHQRDEHEFGAGRLKPTHILAVVGNDRDAPLMCHSPLTPEFCVRHPTAKIPHPGRAPLNPYDWEAWPHSKQHELETACRRLKDATDEIKQWNATVVELNQQLAERTAWAFGLDKQVQEQTEWALRLDSELEERTAWALKLDQELAAAIQSARQLNQALEERTAWAQRLDQELEEQTARTRHLTQELEQRNAHELQLANDLEHLSWARALDRHFHSFFDIPYRLARRVRRYFKGRSG